MKTGIELIAEERQEQIEKHGWDAKHDKQHVDKQHVDKQIALQAMNLLSYYCNKKGIKNKLQDWNLPNNTYGNAIHRLKVAGALIAAEIDRLNAGL